MTQLNLDYPTNCFRDSNHQIWNKIELPHHTMKFLDEVLDQGIPTSDKKYYYIPFNLSFRMFYALAIHCVKEGFQDEEFATKLESKDAYLAEIHRLFDVQENGEHPRLKDKYCGTWELPLTMVPEHSKIIAKLWNDDNGE